MDPDFDGAFQIMFRFRSSSRRRLKRSKECLDNFIPHHSRSVIVQYDYPKADPEKNIGLIFKIQISDFAFGYVGYWSQNLRILQDARLGTGTWSFA